VVASLWPVVSFGFDAERRGASACPRRSQGTSFRDSAIDHSVLLEREIHIAVSTDEEAGAGADEGRSACRSLRRIAGQARSGASREAAPIRTRKASRGRCSCTGPRRRRRGPTWARRSRSANAGRMIFSWHLGLQEAEKVGLNWSRDPLWPLEIQTYQVPTPVGAFHQNFTWTGSGGSSRTSTRSPSSSTRSWSTSGRSARTPDSPTRTRSTSSSPAFKGSESPAVRWHMPCAKCERHRQLEKSRVLAFDYAAAKDDFFPKRPEASRNGRGSRELGGGRGHPRRLRSFFAASSRSRARPPRTASTRASSS
jgi:hypothetical protein